MVDPIQTKAIRDTRANIIGAAYKINYIEAAQGYALNPAERQALVGSPSFWREHRKAIEDAMLLVEIPELES